MAALVFFSGSDELATLTNTFKVNGVDTDPSTISLTITTPAGVATTYTYAAAQITRSGTGIYTKDIACSAVGVWQYVWTGTGAAADIQAGTWTVQSTELQKLYCTPEELKSRLGMSASDTADDFELRLAVESCSRWIDEYCDRQFFRATATRTYASCSYYLVDVDDLVSVTTLKTDAAGDGTFETTWSTTDYQLLPYTAAYRAEQQPYTSIKAVGSLTFPFPYSVPLDRDDRVEIAGVWGWPAVPASVKQACLVLSADAFKLKGAPFGIASVGDFSMRIRDNTRAVALLAPYRRHAVLIG